MTIRNDAQFELEEDAAALSTAIGVLKCEPSPKQRKMTLEIMASILERIAISVDDELRK